MTIKNIELCSDCNNYYPSIECPNLYGFCSQKDVYKKGRKKKKDAPVIKREKSYVNYT